MKYQILNKITGQPIDGILVNDTAKEEFCELMNWKEEDWNANMQEIK